MNMFLPIAVCIFAQSVASAAMVTPSGGADFIEQSLPYNITLTPFTLAPSTAGTVYPGLSKTGANIIERITVLRFSQTEIESLGPLVSAHLNFSVNTERMSPQYPSRTLRITGYSSDGPLTVTDFSQTGNVIFEQTVTTNYVDWYAPFNVDISSFLNGVLTTSDTHVAFRFEQLAPSFTSQTTTTIESIQLNVVPEPSAASALLAGIAVLGFRRIRR